MLGRRDLVLGVLARVAEASSELRQDLPVELLLVLRREVAGPLREVPRDHPQASKIAPLERSLDRFLHLAEERRGRRNVGHETHDCRAPVAQLGRLFGVA